MYDIMEILTMIELNYEESNKNLQSGFECQSCTFERVICLQEGKCLLELQEIYMKAKKD